MSAVSEAQALERASHPNTLLTLVCVAHGMTHMHAALLPLTFPFIIQEFGINYTLLGAMMGVGALVGGLLQFVFGYASHFAPRKVLIGCGNILLGLSTVWGGIAPSFFYYSAARWSAAIVTSPQHPVGNSMIADHFGRERRGFALALNAAAGNLGTLVVPLVAALLIVGFGWRRTLMLFAIPMVVVGLIVIGFAHDPGSPAAQKAQGSRRLGLMVSETKDLLKNPTVAFLLIASLVSAGGRGLGIVLNFIPAYLGDPDKGLGLPTETVGWIYMILLTGSVLGPLALGRLSDKLGARKPVIVAVYAASAIAVLILVGFNPVGWLLQLVILFFGFVVFSESSLIQSFMSDAVPAGARDIMFGTYFAAGFGISALWVVLQGWLVDHYGFAAMFIAMAGSYVVAALFVLGAREHGGAGSPHPAS